MHDPVKPWLNRFLEAAFAVLVAALMLSWAWALLRPLVPVAVVAVGCMGALGVLLRYVIYRNRYW